MRGKRVALALLFAAAAPAAAQDEVLQPPNVFLGISAQYARPMGEFRDHIEHGGGLNFGLVLPVRQESPLALRADGGFIIYGSDTQEVCFSETVGCAVRLDLTTTNSIAYLNAGPQLMVPRGRVQPYVNGAIGFTYFGTSSSVKGTGSEDTFASTTNHNDITFSWTAGGGTLVRLSNGRTPLYLDLSARYMGNGSVEYLRVGDVRDNPENPVPTRSSADLVQFQIGVTLGNRPGLKDR